MRSLFIAWILLSPLTTGLVIPSLHCFAHETRKVIAQHDHSALSTLKVMHDPVQDFGERVAISPKSNEPPESGKTAASTSRLNFPIPTSVHTAQSLAAGPFATVVIEAIPAWPRSGGQEHVLAVPLGSQRSQQSQDVKLPPHSYRAQILPGLRDDVECQLWIELERPTHDGPLAKARVLMTFDQRDNPISFGELNLRGIDADEKPLEIRCKLLESSEL